MAYLDAPVVVSDPDGSVAYVNLAFESMFSVSLESTMGAPLASLFEGGAREAVLRSVAEVCDQGKTVRFRIRQGELGFGAIASPIVAQDARVGVVLLLVESTEAEERLLMLSREIVEPLDSLTRLLDEMLEQTGGRRSEHDRKSIEEGIRALARLRNWTDELRRLQSGQPAPQAAAARFDPIVPLRDAAARAKPEFSEKGVSLEFLAPAQLPAAEGDARRLEFVLTHLLREHLACAPQSSTITLAARGAGHDSMPSVVISIVSEDESSGGPVSALEEKGASGSPPVGELLREIGAEIRRTEAPGGGRITAIRLRAA
jgi:signal transduction histidine kinase